MFTFVKLIKPFFLPPTFIFIGMIVAFFLIRRQKRLGIILFGVVIVVYYVLTIEPTAFLVQRSLEQQTSPVAIEDLEIGEAIVILGGGANTNEHRLFPELGGTSWKRLWHGIEVYKTLGRRIPILYVGGSGDPFEPVSREAELAFIYGTQIGVSTNHLWIERSSRDTCENGKAAKRILDEKFPEVDTHRVILVTSASHMPRAQGVFEKLGMTVLPAPADFGSGTFQFDPLSLFPSDSAFSTVIAGVHEWVGKVGYRLRCRV